MVASLEITSRAVSGSKRTSEEIEFSVLKRKCGLIWFCSASMRACSSKPLLLLQLDLDAHAVENLEFDPDGRHRRGVDRRPHPQVVGLSMLKMECGKYRASSRLHKTQPTIVVKNMICQSNRRGRRQIAPNQAKNALIDEGRERPDVVLIERHGAQLAGDKTAKHTERHRRPLAMQQARAYP